MKWVSRRERFALTRKRVLFFNIVANPDLALRLAMEYQYVAKYNKLRLTSWKLQDKDLSKTIAIALNRIDKSLEKFSISKMCKYCGSWEGSQVQHYCSSNCQILDE